MLQNRYVYLNGDLLPWEQATVHMMSHSFSRGSAIFEVVSFHETDAGPATFRLDRHIDRFFKSAEFLDMNLPLSREALSEIVFKTIRRNEIREGEVKIMGFGNFRVVKRAAREGRDPRTGTPVKIKAAKRPRFSAGKGLKAAVNR